MKITATHKIGENYVVADNRKIYRRPYTSIHNRSYDYLELKSYKDGYYIDGVYTPKRHIKFEKIEPFVIIEIKETPFD